MGVLANLSSWIQPKISPRKEDLAPFVSTLPHRRPSTSGLRLLQKRNVTESSEDSSVTSNLGRQGTQMGLNLSTSPTPSLKRTHVEVVIPSPPQRRQKLFKPLKAGETAEPIKNSPNGFSPCRFPTDTEDNEKTTKRAYPTARNITRSVVSFAMSPRPMPYRSITPIQALRYEFQQKLKRIHGPEVSFNMGDEKVAMLSANFGFLNEYKLQDGVVHADAGFNAGCTCNGPCDPASCDCVEMEDDSDKLISTYRPSFNGQVVLGSEFLERKLHPRILECNKACGCKGKCWNTAVQRGRSVRLQIFDTGGRGLGMHLYYNSLIILFFTHSLL